MFQWTWVKYEIDLLPGTHIPYDLSLESLSQCNIFMNVFDAADHDDDHHDHDHYYNMICYDVGSYYG